MISSYRKRGLIKPILFQKKGTKSSAFYTKDVIDKYYKLNGVTLRDTKGLLHESKVAKIFGLGDISKLRRLGKITSAGVGRYKNSFGHFYNKKVFRELDKIYPNLIKKLNKDLITTKSEFIINNNLLIKMQTLIKEKKLKKIGTTFLKARSLNVYNKKDFLKLVRFS